MSDSARVMRDVSFSRETREWLGTAALSLELLGRAAGLLSRGASAVEAAEIVSMLGDVDREVVLAAAGAVRLVGERWDANDATEFVVGASL